MSFTSELSRKMLAGLTICAGAIIVASVFWYHEVRYSLPTPVPAEYSAVAPGAEVRLPERLASGTAWFLHFYNPDCPCSRFNARHIKSLIRNHEDSVRFAIVVPNHPAFSRAQREFGDDLHYLVDADKSIAMSCGVYSTPQAAIIDASGKLYYRGNYNQSRYCTAKATNFAELSLIALINEQTAPIFGLAATQAYGCELGRDDIDFF